MSKITVIFFYLLFTSSVFSIHLNELDKDSFSTNTPSDSAKIKRFKIIGLPLVFYLPETKWSAGAAGLVTFRMKKDSLTSRPSSVQFGLAFTQLKQTLIYLPFQLWLKNEAYNVFGEIGYYKYNYFFWGIGNNQPFNLQELYDVKYPRIRFNALKRIYKHTYAGIKYDFESFKITRVDSAGILDKQAITGNKGGTLSSLGVVFKFDNRDNLFYATKGYLFELAYARNNKKIGSSFNYEVLTIDFSTYFTTNFKHTLAVNQYLVLGNGDIPFNHMALLGGTKKMRGFYEGRFRDKNLFVSQMEYRAPLFWRLGAVAFVSAGQVANSAKKYNFSNYKIAFGGGLRVMIDKKQKINLRVDVGRAEKKTNFYLTLTEAF